jgi:hypothetical protein
MDFINVNKDARKMFIWAELDRVGFIKCRVFRFLDFDRLCCTNGIKEISKDVSM